LPPSFGFGLVERVNNGARSGNDAYTDSHITVSLVRAPANGRPGMVSVELPAQIATPGMPFRFPLPAELSQAAATTPVQVTLSNGAPLPSWLRYVPIEKSFVANSTPAGALPLEVLVRIGDRSWTVLISGRTRK